MSAWQIGDRVTFDAILRREWQPGRRPNGEGVLAWQARPHQQTSGILVGLRSLQNGQLIVLSEDEGWAWKQKGTVRAALVAVHLRRKLVFVPLDNLRRESP